VPSEAKKLDLSSLRPSGGFSPLQLNKSRVSTIRLVRILNGSLFTFDSGPRTEGPHNLEFLASLRMSGFLFSTFSLKKPTALLLGPSIQGPAELRVKGT
jgi:hypothetical protein